MSFFNELKRRNVIRVGVTYTVVGWVIAQVADLTLESFGTPDWVMKTLLFLMFIGFIVSLFIAWAYEMTPEGIKRAEDVDPGQSITHHTARKLDRLFIVVLLIAVGTLLTERYLLDERVEKGSGSISPGKTQASSTPVAEKLNPTPDKARQKEPSVAVLPFVNMSSDPEQEYFSDGISEEILNVLTRIPNLKVAARTSSFQFKGKNLDIADIGQKLQVNHLLEGSVRKSGQTLRITAQLIETETGFHLWSETFERELKDVFAIQDEIAGAIAVELRTRLTSVPESSSQPVNMEAYELYLKGRALVARRRAEDLLEGIDILKAALDIEPGYAQAMATLAKAYVVLPYFSRALPTGEARRQARRWSTMALEKEPENGEALAVLAIVYNEEDLNPAGARQLLEKAIAANPGNVAVNNFFGDICLRIADWECTMQYESRAAELDPLGPIQLTDLANLFILLGDYGKVVDLARRALVMDPAFLHAHQLLVDAYFILGDQDGLARTLEGAESLQVFEETDLEDFRIKLMIAQGGREQAVERIQHLARLADSGLVRSVDIAVLAVAIGNFDLAGEHLLRAYREKDGTWLFPLWFRLPEQAPDSEPWQEFWRQPGVAKVAELRRSNGLTAYTPGFASGAGP